jgi:hypothetical protein
MPDVRNRRPAYNCTKTGRNPTRHPNAERRDRDGEDTMNLMLHFEAAGIETRLRQARAERFSLLLPPRSPRRRDDADRSVLARVVGLSTPRRPAAQGAAR